MGEAMSDCSVSGLSVGYHSIRYLVKSQHRRRTCYSEYWMHEDSSLRSVYAAFEGAYVPDFVGNPSR